MDVHSNPYGISCLPRGLRRIKGWCLNSSSLINSEAILGFKPKFIRFFRMGVVSKRGDIVFELDLRRFIVLIKLSRLLDFSHKIDESGTWLLS